MFYPSPKEENIQQNLLQDPPYCYTSSLSLWPMYGTPNSFLCPHYLCITTKTERKTPPCPTRTERPHCQTMNFIDLAQEHLNFLNFPFPCCFHYLRSQRRKGKSKLAQQHDWFPRVCCSPTSLTSHLFIENRGSSRCRPCIPNQAEAEDTEEQSPLV